MSFYLKLDRAYEHSKALEDEATGWIKAKPYGIVDEPDPETTPDWVSARHHHRRFRVTRVDPVPDRFSILIGDCVHNLRSALDHLALALARRHTPSMTADEIRGSEFPIFGDRPMSAGEEQPKIRRWRLP